jgi:hypothetical protein
MDLSQRKLSQKEWESLEIPINGRELQILKMLYDGFNDVNIKHNDTQTMTSYIKLEHSEANNSSKKDRIHKKNQKRKDDIDYYIYNKYLNDKMNIVADKLGKTLPTLKKIKTTLKKADIFRIENMESKINNIKHAIFEFILLDLVDKFGTSNGGSKHKYYYTIINLFKYNISNINHILKDNINYLIDEYSKTADKSTFIENAYDYIERNDELAKYKDLTLFPHQKKLYAFAKQPENKLIFYQAPTGTGKTLSPIGLSKKYKIIFVCAAKHVGLQLAKACISLNIKIAVAFGCKDPGNIRLHWNAVKESVRNRKTGGIFRVDNSVGDNVEIMISDVQSYLPAMHYMMAFNKPEELLLFWDEPTITLDYKEHPYHEILSKNWKENEIPNIILSSATLPSHNDLSDMMSSVYEKFESIEFTPITSYDCTKTIPIIDTTGKVVLPHFIFPTYYEIKKCLLHIKNFKTLLRHFDIREITKFIIYVNKNCELKKRFKINNYFENIESIDIISLKLYYLTLLKLIEDDYENIYNHFKLHTTTQFESTIMVTTKDSYTLTDGPTIYLANNVDKIGDFCLKTARIPKIMISAIMEDINSNELIRLDIEKLMKEINKNKDEKKEEDKEKESVPEIKTELLIEKCDYLKRQLKRIQMGAKFIPNNIEHLKAWGKEEVKNAFTSDIDDETVEKIMLLEVSPKWKILLLMGIGVFSLNNSDDYVSIMKNLAEQQKLYLIIASTDYIYGTNYQFCHGYIGKDLTNMTQQKTIQGLGRIGRSDNKKDYSIRLRSDDIINKLFTKSENNIEIQNMNYLFTS